MRRLQSSKRLPPSSLKSCCMKDLSNCKVVPASQPLPRGHTICCDWFCCFQVPCLVRAPHVQDVRVQEMGILARESSSFGMCSCMLRPVLSAGFDESALFARKCALLCKSLLVFGIAPIVHDDFHSFRDLRCMPVLRRMRGKKLSPSLATLLSSTSLPFLATHYLLRGPPVWPILRRTEESTTSIHHTIRKKRMLYPSASQTGEGPACSLQSTLVTICSHAAVRSFKIRCVWFLVRSQRSHMPSYCRNSAWR